MINGLPLPTAIPALQPAELTPRSQVEQHPHPQKHAQALPTSHLPASPNPLNRLSRTRRDLQNLTPSNTPLQKFAKAVIEQGDQQLAGSVANSLIRLQQAIDTDSSDRGTDKVRVPAESTFGLAWATFAEAVQSEPFTSYAKRNKINIDDMVVHPNGTIANLGGKEPAIFDANACAESKAATAAVIAAAKNVVGPNHDVHGYSGGVTFYGPLHTSNTTVAQFYGLPLDTVNSDTILSTLGQLSHAGTFPGLTGTDPGTEPLKQRQKDAAQHIVGLPQPALKALLAAFKPGLQGARLLRADHELAELCRRALIQLIPGTGEHESPIRLNNIPELSSFNVARKKLLAALTDTAFTDFAQQHSIDPTSVRINPGSGDLTGQVNGADTTFTQHDGSGWSAVWPKLQGSVRTMAGGSTTDVRYPPSTGAALDEVMSFYKESMPAQHHAPEYKWEQKNRQSVLAKITEMDPNQSFPFTHYHQLSEPWGTPIAEVPLSPLETLAQAVKQPKQKRQRANSRA